MLRSKKETMRSIRSRTTLVALFAIAGALVVGLSPSATADPKDTSQLRTMVCDNGRTVEAIIQPSATATLHVTTTTENFVAKRIELGGQVIFDVPGFEDKTLVTCETVEFDLTVIGFFTPR
jgi:hypothetical protein